MTGHILRVCFGPWTEGREEWFDRAVVLRTQESGTPPYEGVLVRSCVNLVH